MTTEPALRSIEETLILLERETQAQREAGEAMAREIEALRRQFQAVVDVGEEHGRATQSVRESLTGYQELPQKVADLARDAEQTRLVLTETRAALETNARTHTAESLANSRELRETFRRLDAIEDRLGVLASEAAVRETKLGQLGEAISVLIDWQHEVRQESEQVDLRLQRLTEVSDEIEGRVLATVQTLQERPLEVIHERLQILGELAHRAEEAIESLGSRLQGDSELRADLERRREEYERVEGQVSRVEGVVENLGREIEVLRGETALLDGRHAGLSERVGLIRRDISEMVDHVRAEFSNFSERQERSRRRQIETLEQELRELKFHAPRPPDEP